MASEVQICNLALSHVGSSKEIASLTENSQEANTCNRFYSQCRDQILRDYRWPFTEKIASLGLVEEDPNDEWGYSYRYPTDCIDIIRILSGQRTDTRDTRVSYKLGQDDVGVLIYTDKEDAEINYVAKTENPALFPPDFVMALSFLLAFFIAPRITGGDPFKLGDRALKMFEVYVGRAQANAKNEEQEDVEPDSEFIRSRE